MENKDLSISQSDKPFSLLILDKLKYCHISDILEEVIKSDMECETKVVETVESFFKELSGGEHDSAIIFCNPFGKKEEFICQQIVKLSIYPITPLLFLYNNFGQETYIKKYVREEIDLCIDFTDHQKWSYKSMCNSINYLIKQRNKLTF